MALGESVARAGIRKLVMVTSHGGNSAAMTLVAQDLRAKHGLLAVTTGWSRFGVPDGLFTAEELRHGVHGGAVETSIMLARYPQEVRHGQRSRIFAPPASRWKRNIAGSRRIGRRRSPGRRRTFIPSGAAGDATQATAEKGRQLIDHGARAFCELLADVDKFDAKALSWPARELTPGPPTTSNNVTIGTA